MSALADRFALYWQDNPHACHACGRPVDPDLPPDDPNHGVPHHLTYSYPEGLEPDCVLVGLCAPCHTGSRWLRPSLHTGQRRVSRRKGWMEGNRVVNEPRHYRHLWSYSIRWIRWKRFWALPCWWRELPAVGPRQKVEMMDLPMPFGHHRCRVCVSVLPAERFYPSSLRFAVYVCKDCDREVRAERRRSGRYKDRDRARQRAWRDRKRAATGRSLGGMAPLDSYCPLCDSWLASRNYFDHEDAHMRERAS